MSDRLSFSPASPDPSAGREDGTPVLEARALSFVYGEGTPYRHVALDDVSFSVKKGEFLGVMGHTGSGKSTLMQHLNGLLKPASGSVLLYGRDINESKTATREARFRIGLVMQYPEYQLFEESVYLDIAFGPKNRGLPSERVDELVRRSAAAVGVDESLFDKSPFELSGGQKRRVAIAGVLAMDPEVLILDEPTAGLDPAGQDEILSFIGALHRENGKTVLLVSHSMDTLARVSDRILVLNRSRLAMSGTPAEVFSRAGELEAMGLAIPELTRIFLRLSELGLPLDSPVYTMEYAVRKLTEMKRNGTRLKGGA